MLERYLLYGSVRYALAILRPLQDAIRASGAEAAWFFDGEGAEELASDERWLRTPQEVRAWAPQAIFTSSNALPHFFPGVKVQTFHGFDAGKPRHIYIRPFFDLYCTTGPQDTQAFQALAEQRGYFAVKETGWPKLDPFFKSLDAELPPVREPPVVLYHSTFSPSWSAAEALYEEIKRLSASGEWRWIVTLHPKMDPATVAKYRALQGPYLRYADDDNIIDLFSQADMMCSDTSSALSEFLLTGKPVVTFRNRRPGPQLIDIQEAGEFEPAIRRALARPPGLLQSIRRFADSIHPLRDGCASERSLAAVDEFLAEGGVAGLKRKPFDPWRNLKLRRKLGYWGPA